MDKNRPRNSGLFAIPLIGSILNVLMMGFMSRRQANQMAANPTAPQPQNTTGTPPATNNNAANNEPQEVTQQSTEVQPTAPEEVDHKQDPQS